MRAWPIIDAGTRAWWRTVGRPVDLNRQHSWLRAPVSAGPRVREGWLADEAERLGGTLVRDDPGAGLIPDLAVLDRSGFDAGLLAPQIREFYAHTAAWRMETWSQWSPPFAAPGALISHFFGRRLQQLALPIRSLDVAYGMDSRVVPILDAGGTQLAAGWLRTLRRTGGVVFSGCYGTRTLPGASGASVHVSFPLEAGNVQVFLRPILGPGGSLVLHSGRGRFGQDGAYVVVRHGRGDHAARVPLHETFHVFIDDDGVLRTDHELRLFSARALRLHYKLLPGSGA